MSTPGNNQIENQYDPWMAKNDFYSLSKVFGFSSKSNFSISYSKENGLISLISGPYIILYDLSIDKQVSFIKNPNNKIISCVRFNEKGNILATGEGNCRNGEVRLYQIYYNKNDINFKSIINYKVHRGGIDKILFIRNDEYLLSIGNNEDKTMCLMDLKNKQNFFISKFNRPILACDVSDNFMILCGNKFIKIYNYESYFNNNDDIKNKNLINKSLVELSKLKECAFVNVVIDNNNINKEDQTRNIFFITFDGFLVEMKSNKLSFDRWVHLKAGKGLSLNLWNNLLGCGCSDGLFRIFTTELKHVCTLKYPPPLGHLINTDKELFYHKSNKYSYADVVAALYNIYHNKLVIIYSDKSLIIWDISNYSEIKLEISKISHSGGIKAMDYFIDKENNIIKIITCSDDKTVIYWNIPINELLDNNQSIAVYEHIFYSKYIRHIFYFGNENNFSNFKIKKEEILNITNKNNNNINLNEEEDEYNLTTVRFSPCGNYISIGDNFGNISIYSLLSFSLENKIEAFNGEINSIDIIKDPNNDKIYLSSGSSDNFVSLIDMTQGWNIHPINEDKTEMEKMTSPVISVLFCIDKIGQLKLIVGEQNSTITFFLVNDGILQTLQKNYEDNLKTYCLSYSPSIKKVISGHNGKITIWKTSTNIAQKHFQVNRGDKLLDNFRIASDNSGLIFATSNDDKFIRVRALHDGKLLAKIQVSESISNLYFILDDNFLIASSIEGYLYIYKLNTDLIKKLQKDNELINSTEEKNIIKNKLLLLQKFMESDTSLSKNDKVKNLLNKFQQSEDTTFEDLKILDDFVKEGKKNLNKKPKEIELKEEKNDFDQENKNNQGDDNNFLNKSNIFEKGLREKKISTTDSYIKKLTNRKSLADNYYNSKILLNSNINKNKEINVNKINDGKKENVKDNIDNNEDININKEKNNNNELREKDNHEKNNINEIKEKDNYEKNNINEIKEKDNYEKDNEDGYSKKFSNININEELSNNKISTMQKEEIKEEIEETPSEYQAKIVNNSETQLSETHINNLKITQTSNYGVKSFNFRTIKKGFEICKEQDIYYKPNKRINILSIKNNDPYEYVNKEKPKEKLIKFIESNFINNINDENDLKEIEACVEKFLGELRLKIGKGEKNALLEKIVDKYSKIILDKININNNKDNNNNKKENEIEQKDDIDNNINDDINNDDFNINNDDFNL